jgi:hypothetical protein
VALALEDLRFFLRRKILGHDTYVQDYRHLVSSVAKQKWPDYHAFLVSCRRGTALLGVTEAL